jgi:hypothetical protein
MMIRRLGEIRRSSPAEREFVEKFLKHTARRGPVTGDTWDEAQKEWEKNVQFQNDKGEPNPEVAAMVHLTIVISAKDQIEAMRGIWGGPPAA